MKLKVFISITDVDCLKVTTNRPHANAQFWHKHLDLLVCYNFSTCEILYLFFCHKDLCQNMRDEEFTQNMQVTCQFPYLLLTWHANRSGTASWWPFKCSYFCSEERRGISEETWARIVFYQTNTPFYCKSVHDWTPQLIRLIWNCITTLQKNHNCLNSSERFLPSWSVVENHCASSWN